MDKIKQNLQTILYLLEEYDQTHTLSNFDRNMAIQSMTELNENNIELDLTFNEVENNTILESPKSIHELIEEIITLINSRHLMSEESSEE
jgi:hypothetical protein